MKKLTCAQRKAYLKDSNVCPFCQSPKLDIVGDEVEIAGREARQEVSCSACEASWTDVYRLASVAHAYQPERISFEDAKTLYVHRFTMEHVPAWAKKPLQSGSFPAPHFRTDREWYDNTKFPDERPVRPGTKGCYTTGHTFPLGQYLDAPYLGGS